MEHGCWHCKFHAPREAGEAHFGEGCCQFVFWYVCSAANVGVDSGTGGRGMPREEDR